MTQTESVTKVATAPIANPAHDRLQKAAADQAAQQKQAQIAEAVRKFADVVNGSDIELSFSVDESSNQVIIKVTDANTGKVIRQIPSDEMLRISSNIKEMIGLFYDHSA